MDVIAVLLFVVALGVWDQWFRKKKAYRPNQPQAPKLIDDADRGHRPEQR